jgi:hypothetical protein
MFVFTICERAIGLVRGNRLDLSGGARAMLEALDYEGLIAAQAQEEAITCVRHFAFIRDKLLELYPWVFARKTSAPAQLSTPLSGWRYAYALPADCLKLLALVEVPEHDITPSPRRHGSTGSMTLEHWEQVGRTVCCNHRPVHARYTAQITDVNQWDSGFTDVFCCMLAGEAMAAIIGEPNAIQLMDQRAQAGIVEAHRTGAIAAATGLPAQRNLWMDYSGVPSGFDDHGLWGY